MEIQQLDWTLGVSQLLRIRRHSQPRFVTTGRPTRLEERHLSARVGCRGSIFICRCLVG
ncbi:hypothetical protein MPLB_1680108 [Mesorhizobium sp. ORS 3324]|nr:hypothetical protein MPLB_1680108 [Mesorhizobium sp. ORS 3324]CDX43432.1 hypothetical protein MPLA_670069 [Mesorhizobium sp. ORS 3359]